MAYSNIFKFPTFSELMAMPPEEVQKLSPLFGPNLLSGLNYSVRMYGEEEGRRNWDMMVGQFKNDITRTIDEKVYNILNSGADINTDPRVKDISNDINRLVSIWNQLPSEFRGEQPKTYQQLATGTAKDPYGTQVVSAGGKIETPSDFGKGTGTTDTKGSEPPQVNPVDKKWVDDLYQKYFDRTATSAELNNWVKENPQSLETFLQNESKKYGYTSDYFKSQQNNSTDQKWVSDLYQKYFDRPPTSAELANWTKENPQALEQFLMGEQKKYGYTSKYFQTQNDTKLSEAKSIIDNSNLPPDIKQLFSQVVQSYPPGVEYDTQEIINTFNQIKDSTIDPYFKELSNIAVNDIKNSMADLEKSRALELEQERTAAGDNIRQAKEGLEKSGMTFSGKGIEALGEGSAYAKGATESGLPVQTPFGGLFYEGTVNQGNRLVSSSSSARYQQQLRDIGVAAEKSLGTAGASGLGLNTMGGVTGSLETQKQQQYGSTLNQIISNYRAKQESLTNKNYFA